MNYLEEYMQRMLFLMDFRIKKCVKEHMPICHVTKGFYDYKVLNMCFVNDMVARIAECFYRGYLPVVEVPGGENIQNLWGEYFKQPYELLGIDIDDYGKTVEHLFEMEPIWGPGYKANLIPRELMCSVNMYRELVKFNDAVEEYTQKERREILGEKKILGVLVRGTDLGVDHPKDHPVQPDLEQVLSDVAAELNIEEYDGIYLASEEDSVEKVFRERFPDTPILINRRHYMSESYYEARKTHDIIGLSDVMVERGYDLYSRGLEYLSSLYLLSECRSFIAGNTLGSSAALFLNGGRYKKCLLYDLGFYGEEEKKTESAVRVVMVQGMVPALDYFTTCVATAYRQMGVPVYIINTNNLEKTAGNELEEFVTFGEGKCVLLTFNNIGMLLSEGDQNYWEKHNVSVWSFFVDHPRNFRDMLMQPLKKYHAICQDQNHARFVERYYPLVEHVYFIPNGGMKEVESHPFSERKISVGYFGDCQEEISSFPVLEFFPDGGTEFYNTCISLLKEEDYRTTEEVIEPVLKEYYPEISEDALRQINETVAVYIEIPVRRYYKQKMLRALDQLNISVEIYGKHWEDEEYAYGENIRIHPRISPKECNELMGDTKITLNFLPWQKYGCSERPYNSMLNGSVCCIERSPFLELSYEDGTDILYFDMKHPEKTARRIKELLDEPGTYTLESIAQNGYEKASKNDTWAKRAESILCLMKKAEGTKNRNL